MPYQDLEVGSTNTQNSGFSWGDFAQNAWNLYQDNKNQRRVEAAAQGFADKTKYDPYNLTSPIGGVGFEDGSGMATFSPEMDAIFNDLLAQHANYSDRLQNFDPAAAQQEMYQQQRSMFAPQQEQDRLSMENRLLAQGMLGSTGGAGRTQSLLEAQGQQDQGAQLAAWQQAQQYQNNLQQGQTQSLTDIFNLNNQLSGLFSTGGNLGNMSSANNYKAYADLEAANAAPSAKWGGFDTNSNNPNALDLNSIGTTISDTWDTITGLLTPDKKKTNPTLSGLPPSTGFNWGGR
jgi:hypothetical protein